MDFTAKIDRWARHGESNQLIGHKLLVEIATDWAASGDVRPAVKAVNYMTAKMPKGNRVNAFKTYVECKFGFIWNEEKKEFVKGAFTAKKGLDIKDIANKHWWEFTEEAKYVPIADLQSLINSLVKRVKKDREQLGDKSVVDDKSYQKIMDLTNPTA